MPEASPSHPPWATLTRPEVPTVVLDTNVVLDWLVFGDASCRSLAARIDAGHLRWLSTAAMRAELCAVLPRPELAAWKPDPGQVLSKFDRQAQLHASAPALALPARLTCRDAEDQKFIDLAIAVGAAWLFSRDRALLDLARQAHKHGVEILTPTQWSRRDPASGVHAGSGGGP